MHWLAGTSTGSRIWCTSMILDRDYKRWAENTFREDSTTWNKIKSYRKCFPNSFISHAFLITWHKCPAHSAQTQSVSTFCMVSRLNSSCLIELSSKSTWLLIGNWLFCMQDLPYSVGFWCMLGGKYFQWNTFYISSVKVELTLVIQEVLKSLWPSNNWNRLLFIQIQTLPPRMHHQKWKDIIDFVCKSTNEIEIEVWEAKKANGTNITTNGKS